MVWCLMKHKDFTFTRWMNGRHVVSYLGGKDFKSWIIDQEHRIFIFSPNQSTWVLGKCLKMDHDHFHILSSSLVTAILPSSIIKWCCRKVCSNSSTNQSTSVSLQIPILFMKMYDAVYVKLTQLLRPKMDFLALTGEIGWVPDGLPVVAKENSFLLLGNRQILGRTHKG